MEGDCMANTSANETTTNSHVGYALGYTNSEHERLIRQASREDFQVSSLSVPATILIILKRIGAAMSDCLPPSRAFVLGFLLCPCLHGLAGTVSPSSAIVQENATQQFTASTPSTWTTTCGTISSTGLLRAPLYPSTSCTITANAMDGSGTVTARATVVSPIIMTQGSAKTPQGRTQ